MTTQTIEHHAHCQHIKQHQHWLRLIPMLILGVLLHIAGLVMWVLCALQFLFVIGSGSDNHQLRSMTRTISRFIEQALLYVSYNSDQKPFPFAPWPEAAVTPVNEPAATATKTDAQGTDGQSR